MDPDSDNDTFDFTEHQRKATEDFRRVRQRYEDFADTVKGILATALARRNIQVHSIEGRAKTLESFGRKAAKPSEVDPSTPKYENPLSQIQDLAGVRVITYFLSTINDVDQLIQEQFDVLEKTDKTDLLRERQGLGYQSVHYIVRLAPNRTELPEYSDFRGLVVEIQLRTILQHAWAEIEHDIQYHSIETIPSSIRQRFTSLAGLIEIADREFQAIQAADAELRQKARLSLRTGDLEVEITPDSLKAYLDQKLGPDGRMSDYSYDFTARTLRRMGFSTLKEVDECITGYDDDKLSQLAYGTRQGQLSRFEYQVLAGMGHYYTERHPWRRTGWYRDHNARPLEKFEKSGITIGEYEPNEEAQPVPTPVELTT